MGEYGYMITMPLFFCPSLLALCGLIKNIIMPESADMEHGINDQVQVSADGPNHHPEIVDERHADDTTIFYNKNKDEVRPVTPELERKVIRKNF